jgi:hypothetical protein
MAYDPGVCAIVAIVVLAVAWICVLLRLYVRLYIQRNIAVDDILAVSASVRQLHLLVNLSNFLGDLYGTSCAICDWPSARWTWKT